MKITFTGPVRHDGKDYQPDDHAEIDDVTAESLIAAGVATFAGKKTKATPKPNASNDQQSTAGQTTATGAQADLTGSENTGGDGNDNSNDNDE